MKTITSHSPLQPGYHYQLTAPVGRSFQADFKPDLTPREMLALGVFDGWYFEGAHQEYPKSWFAHAKLAEGGPQPKLNFFGIHASQTRAVWQEKGWIHPDDPRGWFEWYCRYYLGRRHEDDARQIARWKAIRRHTAQIVRNCAPKDFACRPRQRQALLHWAYDSRV